ncbi:UNVERIFIED_CONTAM: hypothetical protein RMT77_005058 [Armadillidium vulgare]
MDSIKIINSDQIGMSSYNKMEEEHASQNHLNNSNQTNSNQKRSCLWPHQWTLTECCCGCNVRTGSLWIGWTFLTISTFLLFGSIIGPLPPFLRWEDILFTVTKMIANLLLLVGIYKNHLKIVRISVILSLIDLVIEIGVSAVLSIIIGHPLPFFVVLFVLPLSLYFIVVVNSLANQMAMGLISLPKLGMNV